MKWITLLCFLFLAGCSTGSNLDQIAAQEKTGIQSIPQVNKLVWEKAPVPDKPAVQIKVVDNERQAVLDKKGMRDLIVLYSSAKDRTDERNKLIDVLNSTVDERNQLLALAKAEELRSNGLSADLAAERKARISDQKSADLQLTVTRLIAAIAIGFAL